MEKQHPGSIQADPGVDQQPAQAGDAAPGGGSGNSHWLSKTILFLAGQAFSLFGSSLVQFAIIWYITLQTQSGVMMTISTVCGFAPQLAISLFAGVWADRYDRKRIIVLADALIAAATLALAVVFFLGHGALWMLFAASAVRSLGAGLQTPAVSAFVPQIVPADKLMRVNGIAGTMHSLIMLVSPAVSGALFALARLEYIFFIDVVTAAVAIVILLLLKVPPHRRAAEALTTGYFADLGAGLRYVFAHPLVRTLLLFFAAFMFLVVPAAFLTPLMVTRNFGPDVLRLTAIEILFSVGSLLGGIIVSVWGGFKDRGMTIAVTSALFGVLTVALGFPAWFWVFLVLMALTGFLIPFSSTASTVLLQQKVEPGYHGRVFSLMGIVTSSVMPLGMLLFGPLADSLRIEVLLIGTGIMMIALGVWAWFNKHLRNPKG